LPAACIFIAGIIIPALALSQGKEYQIVSIKVQRTYPKYDSTYCVTLRNNSAKFPQETSHAFSANDLRLVARSLHLRGIGDLRGRSFTSQGGSAINEFQQLIVESRKRQIAAAK
jgi:hypothetical protein